MEADPTEIGIEGNVLINELLQAYEPMAAGPNEICRAILPSRQESEKLSYVRYTKSPTDRRLPSVMQCLQFKQFDNDAKAEKAVARHLNAGFALSNLYCDTFFRRISMHSAKRRFARGAVNDVGAAISAILGLSGAGGALAGGIGAGFGLVDGTIRQYDDAFLVAADLPTLQNAVREKQDEYQANIRKVHPKNYADATMYIIRYANFCSFTGMRALITNKLAPAPINPAETMAKAAEYIASYQTMTEAVAKKKKELEEAAKAKKAEAAPAAAPAAGADGSASKIEQLAVTPQ